MSEVTSNDPRVEPVQERAELMTSRGRFLVYGGLSIALIVRLLVVLTADFPLNDGGMFMVMIRNLQASHYALPHFTDYNGLHIPFAYPPLGFYAAAFLSDLTHTDPITILRVLPLLLAIAAVGAFALLARSILGSGDAAVIATVAFGLLPHSVLWQVMGGGLTRGFGLFFALLTLHQGYELFAHRVLWRAAPTAIFASLTVLSHPQRTWLLAFSLALFFFWYGRNQNGLLGASLVVAATFVLTSPWWVTVIVYHGIGPFLASVHTGSASAGSFVGYLLPLDMTGEVFLPVFALLGLLGIAWSIQTRQWMLPAWFAITLPLDPRGYLTDVLLPVALLAGLGTVEILLPWVARIERTRSQRWHGRLIPIVATCVLIYVGISMIAASASLDVPLSREDRVAMAWVAQNTPKGSRFLVISGSNEWTTDRQSEWFPALSGRMSIATVQGTEWLPNKRFASQLTAYDDLQECADQRVTCVDKWSMRTDESFDYLYVSETAPITSGHGAGDVVDSPHHDAIEFALKSDSQFTLVFENSGAAIFRRDK
ncbi:MAG: hypothetical protein WBW04_04970 [Nitrolancea sp.]